MNTSQADSGHLTTGQVAAILDKRLDGRNHQAAIAHLSICAECRHELAELERAIKDGALGRRAVRRWIIMASAVAAVLIMAVLPLTLGRWRSAGGGPPAAATRAPGSLSPDDAPSPIGAVVPGDGAVTDATPTLIWRSAAFGASYRVTVQDTSGAVIWSAPITDTTATIPPSARLVHGRRYFWLVEARLRDGTSASTGAGVRVFTVR
jgi:hypothetical protein